MSHSNSWLFGTAQDVERYRAERGREGEEMSEMGKRGNKLLPLGSKLDKVTSGSKIMTGSFNDCSQALT